MLTRSLGRSGPRVSAIGLGCMGMSDLYGPPDEHESVATIQAALNAGHVRCVGLSEVGADTIRRAHRTHPVTDLQIEYSLISRGIERAILPEVRALGVGITAYGVLSRGLLGGLWSKDRSPARGDLR